MDCSHKNDAEDESYFQAFDEEMGNSKKILCKLLDVTEEELRYEPPRMFSSTFEAEIWKKFYDYDNGTLIPYEWPGYISAALGRKIGCSFTASTAPKYRENVFISVFGHCSGDCEMRYGGSVMEKPIPGEGVVMQIKAIGRFVLLQNKHTNRQLRSAQRKEVKKELERTGSFLTYSVNLVHSERIMLLHRNREYGNLGVLRKAKSEGRVKGREPDIYKALRELLEEFRQRQDLSPNSNRPGFIQDLGIQNEQEKQQILYLFVNHRNTSFPSDFVQFEAIANVPRITKYCQER